MLGRRFNQGGSGSTSGFRPSGGGGPGRGGVGNPGGGPLAITHAERKRDALPSAIEDSKKKTKPSPPEPAIALLYCNRQAKRKPDIPKEAPSAKAKIEMAAPNEICALARKLAANMNNKRRIAAMTPKVIDRGPPSSVFQAWGRRLGDDSDDVPTRVISTMFDKKRAAKDRKQRKDSRVQSDQLALARCANDRTKKLA